MAENYSVEAILSVVDRGFTSGMKNAGGMVNSVGGGIKSFSGGLAKMAGAFGVATLATDAFKKGIGTISNSIDGAISRVDTLDNAERVFSNMGFEAAETAKMMDNLNDSITGLPSTLDGSIKSVQTLASATGDLHGSEAIFSALNNGILGFGGSAQNVDSVVQMFSRSLTRGRVQGDEWNTMMDQMGPVINAVAKEMGYTTEALRNGLSDGTISIDTFTDALLDMNENGGGGLASLEQIAQDSTKGIRTSMANASTAITRGVATIIQKFNEGLENAGLMSISEMIGQYGANFNKVLITIANNIEPLIGIVGKVVDAFKSMRDGFKSVFGIGISIGNMFDSIGGAISHLWSLFMQFVGQFTGGTNNMQKTFVNFGYDVGKVVKSVVEWITNIADRVQEVDFSVVENAFKRLQSIISNFDFSQIVDLAVTFKDILGNAIMFVIEKTQELWKGFKDSGAIDAIVEAFKELWEVAKSIGSSWSDLTGNMRSETGTFEAVGKVIGNIVKVGADLLVWVGKAVAGFNKFLSVVNPKIILAVVGAFAGFKVLQNFNPFRLFQRNAEKGIGGVGKSAKRGGGIIQQIFKGLGSVIGSVAKGISTVLTSLSKSITTVLKGLGTFMQSLAKSIGTVLTALSKSISTVAKGVAQALTTALKGLASAIRMIPIPHMLAFAAALALVIASLALLATQGDGVKKMLEGVGNAVAEVVTAFGVVLVGVIEAFGRVLENHANSIIRIIEAISEGFGNFAKSVGESIATVMESFEPLLEILTDGFVEVVDIITDAIVEITEIFAEHLPVITEFLENMTDKIPNIIDAFGRLAESIGNAIATIISALGENAQGIITAFGTAFETAGNTIVRIIGAIGDNAPKMASAISTIIAEVGETAKDIIEAFGTAFETMGGAIEGVIETLAENAQPFADAIGTVLEKLGESEIITQFGDAFESMGNAISTIINSVTDVIPKFSEGVSGIIETIGVQARTTLRVFGTTFETMGGAIEGVIDAMSGYVSTFTTGIADIIAEIGIQARTTLRVFGETFETMGDTISDVIGSIGDLSTTFSENIIKITDAISGQAIELIETFGTTFEQMGETVKGVIDTIGDNAGKIADAIDKIADAFVKLDTVPLGLINTQLAMIASELLLIGRKNRARSADTINNLKEAFTGFPDITSLGSNLGAVALALEKMTEVEGAVTPIINVGNASKTHSENVSKLSEAFKSFPDMAPFGVNMGAVAMAIEKIATNIGTASSGMGDLSNESHLANTNIGKLNTTLETLTTNISSAITNLVTFNTTLNATRLQTGVTESKIKDFDTTIRDLGKTVTETMQRITTTFNTGLSGVLRVTSTTITSIQALVTSSLSAMTQSVSKALSNIVDNVNRGTSQVRTVLASAMQYIAQIINTGMMQARLSVSNNMNQIISIMNNVSGRARSAGYDAGMGFRNGLASTENSIMGTARRIANNVASTMRRALQTHSPSRVTQKIGQDTGMGQVVGMEDMLPKVRSMADKLAEASVMSSTISDLHSGNLSANYVSDINVTHTKQPLYLNFRLGNHDYKLFVEDITAQQSAQAVLERY